MKIATFNINNVNKRLRNLLAWLEAAKPDVVCHGFGFPGPSDRKSRLPRGLAGAKIVERSNCARVELYALDAPVVLTGDYNIVPTDADIFPTKSYKNNALVQPEPRALFARLLGQGWIDAIRTLHPDAKMYTFWDTCGTSGSATPGSGSIICCRTRKPQSAS